MFNLNRKQIAWILIIILIYIIFCYSRKKFSKIFIEESFTDYFNNSTVYDDYYSKLYDKLFYSDNKNNNELRFIEEKGIKEWNDNGNVSILDIGCGTGKHIEILARKYKTTGLDKSDEMLNVAKKNIENKKLFKKPVFVQGDANESGIFEGKSFSHIICMFFTLYYMPDKDRFFKNCNYWLKKDGIMCVHIVNRKKFDPILDKASPFPMFSLQRYDKTRYTKSTLIFNEFKYDSEFKFGNEKTTFHEVFDFNKNKSKRNNIHTLYMPSISEILTIARKNGFKILGNADLTDAGFEYQYIFFMQKK